MKKVATKVVPHLITEDQNQSRLEVGLKSILKVITGNKAGAMAKTWKQSSNRVNGNTEYHHAPKESVK